MLVVLHAGRGAASIRRFRELPARRPLVVAVTGTDIYGDRVRSIACAEIAGGRRSDHRASAADRR